MAPLTGDVARTKAVHHLRLTPLPVKAGVTIFVGAAVCSEDATGLAVPGADAAGLTFQGVAHRGYDNSLGSDGVLQGNRAERHCEVDDNGPYAFAVQGTAPRPGQDAFLVDDNTVSADATVNNIRIGAFTEPDSMANHWFVDVER